MTSTIKFDQWENTASTKSVTMDQIAGGSGLVPVVPTSIDKSGGTVTVNSLGEVTYSGTSVLRLNGVFSSKYRNYKIIIRNTAMTAGVEAIFARFSASGVDTTSTSYQFITAAIANVDTAFTRQNYTASPAATYTHFGYAANDIGSKEITVFSPNTTDKTLVQGQGLYDYGNIVMNSFSGTLYSSTQYDGINIYPATGTFTGTVTIYGLR